MRIRLDTIGCRLNIGEIEAMARRLAGWGHRVVAPGEAADLCIVNTCTVTSTASRKSRHFIRQLRHRNPEATIVVTGCLAQLEPSAIATLGADLVIGNDAKDELPGLLLEQGVLPPADLKEHADEPLCTLAAGRTRAFLKVQDGCNNRCAFCVVATARGRGRSRPADDVVSEVRSLLRAGYREVVLSGVHLGSYGHDLGRPRGLEELVRKVLAESDIPRLRLSSIEPWDLDPTFFELFADRRVLPHLHLPLQSGCDATLRRMVRKITAEAFGVLVAAARRAIPDLAVSTDIMVGFPGETDAEFEASATNAETLAFSRLHVFRYSRREGTPAATMPDQVPGRVALERSRVMHALGDRLTRDFHRSQIGRRSEVLWEGAEELGDLLRWNGLTDNYIRVVTETSTGVDLANQVTEVTLEACLPGGMYGSVDGVSGSDDQTLSRRHGVALPTAVR